MHPTNINHQTSITPNNYPLVSVIIPTFQRPNYLERALTSVLKQTYPNLEIIIVDDNNEGDTYRKKTEELLKKYSGYKNIKYLKHKNNLGVAEARNTGIKAATGKYICFLDDDDEYLPEKIYKQYLKFKNSKYNKLGFVYCWAKEVYSDGGLQRLIRLNIKGRALAEHIIHGLCGPQFIFLSAEIFSEVGFFNKLIVGEDFDLILRILEKGYNVDLVSEILLVLHFHNKERLTNSLKQINTINYFFKKKKAYFHLLKKKEILRLKHYYYISLAWVYLQNKMYLKAFYYFLLAISRSFFNIKNINFLLTVFLGQKIKSKLINFFYKVESKILYWPI